MECSGPGVWVTLLSNRRASPAGGATPRTSKASAPAQEPLGISRKPLAALMQTHGRMQVEVLGVLVSMPGEKG